MIAVGAGVEAPDERARAGNPEVAPHLVRADGAKTGREADAERRSVQLIDDTGHRLRGADRLDQLRLEVRLDHIDVAALGQARDLSLRRLNDEEVRHPVARVAHDLARAHRVVEVGHQRLLGRHHRLKRVQDGSRALETRGAALVKLRVELGDGRLRRQVHDHADRIGGRRAIHLGLDRWVNGACGRGTGERDESRARERHGQGRGTNNEHHCLLLWFGEECPGRHGTSPGRNSAQNGAWRL